MRAKDSMEIHDKFNRVLINNLKMCFEIRGDTCLLFKYNKTTKVIAFFVLDLATISKNSAPLDAKAFTSRRPHFAMDFAMGQSCATWDFSDRVFAVASPVDVEEGKKSLKFSLFNIVSKKLIGRTTLHLAEMLISMSVTRTNLLCVEQTPNARWRIHVFLFKDAEYRYAIELTLGFGLVFYAIHEFRSARLIATSPTGRGGALIVVDPVQRSCTLLCGPEAWKGVDNVETMIVPKYEFDEVGVRVSGLGRDQVYITCEGEGDSDDEEVQVRGATRCVRQLCDRWEFASLG
ncbi:hypothetical protein HK097_006840 [Rhizophlyctis rosea]|uniref:Uncharacterized protein n=1 Tax=Rhizophlyctis rosea TaxID=64517 RepID=A0AAD5SE90_9FUNG|nr:hypothetical protein HK097_006840 [Rhizophlyctis rosea]